MRLLTSLDTKLSTTAVFSHTAAAGHQRACVCTRPITGSNGSPNETERRRILRETTESISTKRASFNNNNNNKKKHRATNENKKEFYLRRIA